MWIALAETVFLLKLTDPCMSLDWLTHLKHFLKQFFIYLYKYIFI